jgi:hypothetical protein
MSESNSPSISGELVAPPSDNALQFDQAEFQTKVEPRSVCGFCHKPIDDAYYELVGKVVCGNCKAGIETARSRAHSFTT